MPGGTAGSQRVTGALICGTFGVAFMLANADTPLGATATVTFRFLAGAGLIVLYVAAARARRLRPAASRPTHPQGRARGVRALRPPILVDRQR